MALFKKLFNPSKPFFSPFFSRLYTNKITPPLVLNPIEVFDFDKIDGDTFQNKTLNILDLFPVYKEPFKQMKPYNPKAVESYFTIKLVKEPYVIHPIFNWYSYRLLGIVSLSTTKVYVVHEDFKNIPKQLIGDLEKCHMPHSAGFRTNIGFDYQTLCKSIRRRSLGEPHEYHEDINRILHFTRWSAIFPEMRENIVEVFKGEKVHFTKPGESLARLFRFSDKISEFVRKEAVRQEAGEGANSILLDGIPYDMSDFEIMISLINCGRLSSLDSLNKPRWNDTRKKRNEIRDISPPRGVKAAMEMQAEAERKKRALVLESEGERQAHINIADGKKSSVILASEAAKMDQVNRAQGERQAHINIADGKKSSVILASEAAKMDQVNRAQGEAEAILAVEQATTQRIALVSGALKNHGGLEAASLGVAEQYIDAFGNLAKKGNTLLLPAKASSPASEALGIYKNLTSNNSVTGLPEIPEDNSFESINDKIFSEESVKNMK